MEDNVKKGLGGQYRRVARLLVFVFLLVTLTDSSRGALAPDCPGYEVLHAHSPVALREIQFRGFGRRLSQRLHETSDRLAEEIRHATASGEPYVVDDLGIGAGPLNAVAFANLRATDPRGRRLILEGSDTLGTFDKLPDFTANTVELPGDSQNVLPGLPVQPRDMNPSGSKFVNSSLFGDATVMGYHYSEANVAFNQKVVRITEQGPDQRWPARYRVETASGLVVYAKRIFVGTGMGEPAAKVKDAASQVLIQGEKHELDLAVLANSSEYAPGLVTVDDFLQLASRDVRAARSALARYGEGKKFAVVGGFDGGRIGVERLLEEAKTGPQILWVGLPSMTLNAFRASLGERYGPIADHWNRFQFGLGHVTKVEKIVTPVVGGEPRVQWRLTYGNPDQSLHREVVDHVIFATGYQNGVHGLFEGLRKGSGEGSVEPIELSPIVMDRSDYTTVPYKDPTTVVGARVKVGDRGHDIFVLGRATGISQSSEEQERGFLGTAGPAVAALASGLGKQSAKGGHRLPEELRGDPSGKNPFSTRVTKTKVALHPSAELTLLDLKIHLGQSFDRFLLPPSATLGLEIKREGGQLTFLFQGLETESAAILHRQMAGDEGLLRLVNDAFEQGRERLMISLPTRRSGAPKLEEMSVTSE